MWIYDINQTLYDSCQVLLLHRENLIYYLCLFPFLINYSGIKEIKYFKKYFKIY
jgi:hypothetical protein